ncbi:MAG: tetratricopeptide repeat protein [Phycisphaerales bacterium]
MITSTRSAILTLLVSAGLCAPVSTAAMNNSQQPAQSNPAGANADRTRVTLTEELPWLLHRAAVLDLRLHESPTPSDYECAAILLELGLRLDPENGELARDMAQAAWLAGDTNRMHEATRQIIRIDPSDTVAQLRLISARINEKQTLEERKALYDRFLSDAGKSIDPSVRSRLALDAALLEREAGNTAGFIERLHQATRLDGSNKAAASLAAQYYSAISDDQAVGLDYQVRLLKADPLDANVHLTIARMLAGQGAIEASKRFLYNAIELFSLETGKTPENIEEIRIAIEWQADGAEKPMGPLEAVLIDQRTQAQARIKAYEDAQLPTDGLIRPQDIRFTLGVDKLRILAAHAEEDREQVRSILDDIERTISEDIARLAQMATAPGANVNALLVQVVRRMSDLNSMRTVVGLDADRIREELEAMEGQMPAVADQLRRIEPMALFAEGKFEEALALADQYPGSPVLELVRAQCYERLGRTDEAIERYIRLAHSNVTNAYGAFAHARLHKLGAGDRILTEAGSEMIEIASRVPDWIEQMIERPSSFQYLSVEHEKLVYDEGERPVLKIRLQNTAPVPLSVGPNAPISSRVLIEPVGVATQHNQFRGTPRPKVLQLDTRIRLKPRETMTVEVVADSVSTDWLIEQQPSISMRQRWRLIQGFRTRLADSEARKQQASPDQRIYGIVNSPLGLTAETPVVQRLGLRIYDAEPSELIDLLSSNDSDAHRRAIGVITARLINPTPESRFDQASLDRIIETLNELYTRSKPETRCAMMLMLPHRHQAPSMVAFDDHVASSLLSESLIESTVDPLTLVCALLTRTDDPEAPIFETLEHVQDDGISRFAQLIRARLRAGEPTLGKVGPGVEAMTPRFDGLDY